MARNPRCEIWKYFNNIAEEGVAVCKLCNKRLSNLKSNGLRSHISILHNPRNKIWKYFDNIVSEGVGACKICNKRVRNNRQFNLALHLKQHGICIEGNNENQIKNMESDVDNEDESFGGSENLCVTMNRETLVGAVMGLMINDGVPPHLFASQNMQALLNPICEAISKEEIITFNVSALRSEKAVHSVANYICKELANELRCRLISLKIDMEINRSSNIYRISVQFINEARVETRMLGQITLKDKEQLSGKSVMHILHKFNINYQQILSAYWDNSKTKFNCSVPNSDYLREIQQFENNSCILVGEIKVERYIGVIAQLCILDIFKNHSIFQLFMECRNLVKFINAKPNIFHEAFKQNNLKVPQLDTPWKWGSTYQMMNELKEALSVIEIINYKQPKLPADQFNFNDYLKNFIDAFCKTLHGYQKIAEKFYTSEMIYGDFYYQWLKCKAVTRELYTENIINENILTIISSELLKSIENRSDELLNQGHLKACLYLDPRFQHNLSMPEKVVALEYLQQLWNLSKLYNSTQNEKFLDNNNVVLKEFLSPSVQESDSIGFYKKFGDLQSKFQWVDTNILAFWKHLQASHPEIYFLSTIGLAIPATQNYNKVICSQRCAFSKCSKKCQYLKEHVDFIRLNQHLLNKAIQEMELFRDNSSAPLKLADTTTKSLLPPSNSNGGVDI